MYYDNKSRGYFPFCHCSGGSGLGVRFWRIFQKVVCLYVAPDDETLDQALNHFVAYYEQSEMFDLYKHGTGPGLLGVVMNLLKSNLGGVLRVNWKGTTL